MRKTTISMVLLSLSLILSGFTSCDDERPMPLEFVYVIDLKHLVCAKKQIVDKENFIFQHVEDLPILECDGNTSIAKDDFPAFRDWVKWAIQKVTEARASMPNGTH